MTTIDLSWNDVFELASNIARKIEDARLSSIYPIPTGGILAALLVTQKSTVPLRIVEKRDEADCYVDDIVDSGKTRQRFSDKPFFALVNKQEEGLVGKWIRFPWERMTGSTGCEDNIRRIIEFIGDDPNREGLIETPQRIVKAYQELFSGYRQDSESVLKTFQDGACDEMVVLKTNFYSICEHHMLPFFGKAWIAYLPNKRVVGVSKLIRLLEVFSRRLQIQERLCQQVTQALDEHLKPLGSACILQARHMCMEMRGVNKRESLLVTSSLTGVFRENPTVRQELLSLIWNSFRQ
mgnify:FL=1